MSQKLIKIKEEFLYSIWKSDITNKSLKSVSGDLIEILSKGSHHPGEEGPDFKNAKVRINGISYIGDIEIDTHQSDWIQHGHNLNKKFNSVILHLFAIKESKKMTPYTESGRKVESVPISDFLETNIREAIQNSIANQNEINKFFLPCKELNYQIPLNDKLEIVKKLGISRLDKKCKKFLERLKEIRHEQTLENSITKEPLMKYSLGSEFYSGQINHEDFKSEKLWMQLFYENLFEALGYTKNKDNFRQLAQEVSLDFLIKKVPEENFIKYSEFVFYKVSGLIPEKIENKDDNTELYIAEIDKFWSSVGEHFQGLILSGDKWHFQQIRPQNFPTIRIAGGVRIIRDLLYDNLLGKIFSIFEKTNNSHLLIKSLKNLLIVKANGYWKNHFHFNRKSSSQIKYFVGNTRSEEIILNVILPFINVLNIVFENKRNQRKVEIVYRTLNQNGENQLVKEISESLGLQMYEHVSLFQQGLIELFRENCSRKKCRECEIGKKVFNQ